MTRYSYSNLACYQQCPAKYRYENVLKLPRETAAAASRGTDLHSELEQAINSGNPPDHLKPHVWDLIARFAKAEVRIELDANWQPTDEEPRYVGVIDVLIDRPPHIDIIDWKSGKVRDYSDQLMFYNVLALSRGHEWRTAKAKAIFIDAGFRQSPEVKLARADLTAAQQRIDEKIERLERDTIFAPNPSFLCRYCSYRKDNGGPCKW